jgi:hypothetical protein
MVFVKYIEHLQYIVIVGRNVVKVVVTFQPIGTVVFLSIGFNAPVWL